MSTSKVTDDGKIKVPPELRQKLGLKTGQKVEFQATSEGLLIRKHLDNASREKNRDATDYLSLLETWANDPEQVKISEVRQAMHRYIDQTSKKNIEEILPYAKSIFEKTGYLKDFKAYRKYARKVGYIDVFEESNRAIKKYLPDLWIKEAIRRGRIEEAMDCWYENEEHRRIRHCADDLINAIEERRPELVISCRLSTVEYYIGRKARRHYQRACNILRKLRDELHRMDAKYYWKYVIDDLRAQYGHLPALIDEFEKAGFFSAR